MWVNHHRHALLAAYYVVDQLATSPKLSTD
jgi:hypothetical protein